MCYILLIITLESVFGCVCACVFDGFAPKPSWNVVRIVYKSNGEGKMCAFVVALNKCANDHDKLQK